MTTDFRKMFGTIYYRVLYKSGSIPKCNCCNSEIKIDADYVAIGERRRGTKRYCLKCAKEKNIIPKRSKKKDVK